ncbi:MAG: Hsp20/alpha crystallin family protein [Deltaproteobacteria bacterium]|jgi:HSP20 family protein|nr:Hsp20/alpha crystallin family protein [Deltaproteobacteria bacterium]
MTVESQSQELNPREKRPLDLKGAESTSGEPRFSPLVDIWESDECLTVVADMPGVAADGLSVNLHENVLTILGKVAEESQGRKLLSQEFETGDYYRQFALSELIDQAKIKASMKDGVLILTLPKQAPAQPRKIEVVSE